MEFRSAISLGYSSIGETSSSPEHPAKMWLFVKVNLLRAPI